MSSDDDNNEDIEEEIEHVQKKPRKKRKKRAAGAKKGGGKGKGKKKKKRKKQQEIDEEIEERIHKEKCCSTKLFCIAIVLMFVGLVLMITSVGLYNANDLDQYSGSQGPQDCYVTAFQIQGSRCNTESCTNCYQPTYFLGPKEQATCGSGGSDGKTGSDVCEEWDNGCIAVAASGSCRDLDSEDEVFSTGTEVNCYIYDTNTCIDAGKIDPNDEWKGQYTTWQAVLAFCIILLIISIVFFAWGAIRCLCKKVENENDVVEEQGTGCYWCLDYDRCCYGTGSGHATMVRKIEKKPTRKTRKKSDGEKKNKTKKSKPKKEEYEKKKQKRDEESDNEQSSNDNTDDEAVELQVE